MAQPVPGYLGYDPVADRPLVKLAAGTKKLKTEDDGGGSGGGPHKTTHEDGGSDEINVTGLEGELVNAQRVEVSKAGTFVSTRKRLNFIEGAGVTLTVADNSANLRADITISAGGGVSRYPFTLRAVNTAQTSADEIGVLQFNGADFPSHTKTLVVNLEVAAGGQLATLELFNLTDGSTVTTVTSSSTVTEKKTATVTLPAADKLYGLRLSRTGGSVGQHVSCRSAALELRA